MYKISHQSKKCVYKVSIYEEKLSTPFFMPKQFLFKRTSTNKLFAYKSYT